MKFPPCCLNVKDTPGVSIKPDMSPDEDFVRMSNIIQSGTIYVKKGFVDLVDFSYKEIDTTAQVTNSNPLIEDPSVTDNRQSDWLHGSTYNFTLFNGRSIVNKLSNLQSFIYSL